MKNFIAAKASIQIQKPINTVFNAIIDPEQMKHYFIAAGTGKLETDKTVKWKFPEFDDEFPVTAKVIKPNDYISFDWSGGAEGMLVELFLESQADSSTVVRIKEGQMKADEEGIKQAIGQTEGWANFLACLKAYLEHGVHLRVGAFDFMSTKK